MTNATSLLGNAGEAAAATWYEHRGYEVLARNWRNRRGEIDLVVLAPTGALVIVEVKTRRTTAKGSGFDAVTPVKQQRLRRLALEFVAAQSKWFDTIRFDVAVVTPMAGELCVEVLEAAY
ncbi:MAG TPA: YraN family protein [Acidimicrobiaceae bacterium]|jgi:putative endonuclease|nr:YraN family protein [Acidimicrobiaceae bacterium]